MPAEGRDIVALVGVLVDAALASAVDNRRTPPLPAVRPPVENPTLTVHRLDVRRTDVQRDAGDSHRMHVRVMQAAGHHTLPGGPRVLWAQPRPDVLVIQAAGPAGPEGLPAGYVLDSGVTPVPTRWAAGRRVRFSVIASPSRRPARPRDAGGRRPPDKRIPIPLGERDGWLRAKLAAALEVHQLQGQQIGTRVGRRPHSTVAHMRHAWAGDGTVADPQALAALILAGVGPAKGYGCGLLVVREAA